LEVRNLIFVDVHEVHSPLSEVSRFLLDLSLYIVLSSLNLHDTAYLRADSVTLADADDERFVVQAVLHFTACSVNLSNLVLFAESSEVDTGLVESGFSFENVEQSLSAELSGMGSQEDIIFGVFGKLFSELDSSLEVEFFKEGLGELSEAVGVVVLLSHDNWKSDHGQSVSLELDDIFSRIGLRLVDATAE